MPLSVLGVVWRKQAERAQRGLNRPCLLLSRRMQASRTMWAITSTHQQARPTLAVAVTVVSLMPMHILWISLWHAHLASLVQEPWMVGVFQTSKSSSVGGSLVLVEV